MKHSVTTDLFIKYPQDDEGALTRRRLGIVSYLMLAKVSESFKLNRYVMVNPCTIEFFSPPCQEQRHSPVPTSKELSADILEALIGASCHDGTYPETLEFLATLKLVSPSLKVRFDPISFEAARDNSLCGLFELEKLLQYRFNNILNLKESLTHETMCKVNGCGSYERLEFLGGTRVLNRIDAVLEWLMSRQIHENVGRIAPELFSNMRQRLVSNAYLCQVAIGLNLHVFFSRPSNMDVDIQNYLEQLTDDSEIDKRYPKYLADLTESLIGAVFGKLFLIFS